MIIDEIIALVFGLIIAPIIGLVSLVFSFFANFVLLLIELVVGIFVEGFSLGRVKKYKKKESSRSEAGVWGAVLILVVVCSVFAYNSVAYQNVQFVAEDGHSIPLASIVVHTSDGEKHMRTDTSGQLEIPRFDLTKLEIRSTRYRSKVWSPEEIETTLVVKRTLLGSSLDKIVDKLSK